MYRYLGALLEINSYLYRRRFPVATDSNITPFYKKKKKTELSPDYLPPENWPVRLAFVNIFDFAMESHAILLPSSNICVSTIGGIRVIRFRPPKSIKA